MIHNNLLTHIGWYSKFNNKHDEYFGIVRCCYLYVAQLTCLSVSKLNYINFHRPSLNIFIYCLSLLLWLTEYATHNVLLDISHFSRRKTVIRKYITQASRVIYKICDDKYSNDLQITKCYNFISNSRGGSINTDWHLII